MPRPVRFLQTTAFKLSAIYFAVFTIFAVAVVLYVSHATNQILNQQIQETVATEVRGLTEQARTGGIAAVLRAIDSRSRQPGASLYLVADAEGRMITGNVAAVPSRLLDLSSNDVVTVPYERAEDPGPPRLAMIQIVQLPAGLRMLVGRDVSERQRFQSVIGRALAWSVLGMVGLALISWFFVSRRVLKRIDSAAATSRRIMAGDLSGRLDVAGTGDEFDRLAESLNSMLDRIEHLLNGLKEVSDNIAHDLKTPLTRLRNRVEATLAGEPDPKAYRAALEATIDESDQLIKTFNALLMIARIEAGTPDSALAEVDLAEVVGDVVDLYEPTAEEAGVELVAEAAGPLPLKASRELLGQALANLVDNAIKYARPAEDVPSRIEVSATRQGEELVLRVADNGPGIQEQDRQRVLQRFVRLEKSRSAPGSGLGLSLAAAVAGFHGGRIELGDNAPGLTVTIFLPAGDRAR